MGAGVARRISTLRGSSREDPAGSAEGLPYTAAVSETRFGTFEELLAATVEPLRPVVSRLREIVLEIDPGATEVVRLGDRAATYGLGPKKMSEGYCYVLPYAKWVNIGFYAGAQLPDPTGLLEGTGAKLRHVKVRSLDEADDPAIRDLIIAALAERKAAPGRRR